MNIEQDKSVNPREERLKGIDTQIASLIRREVPNNQGLEGRPVSLFILEALEFLREAVTRNLPNEGRGYQRLGVVKPTEIQKVFGEDKADIIAPSYSVNSDTNRPVRNSLSSNVVVWRKPANLPTF